MTDETLPALTRFGEFVANCAVPPAARRAARDAVLDTVGVALAGSVEPAARMVRSLADEEGGAPRCGVLGAPARTGAGWAALANGTAAHALDFDDMCFVSMAHPSAPLVAAGLAAAELADAGGGGPARRLLRRLRGRGGAGAGDEPHPLRAGVARHLDHRHPRRGRRRGPAARAGPGHHRAVARHRRGRGVRPEGELRHHGQAAPGGARGAQRGARGDARPRGVSPPPTARWTARRGCSSPCSRARATSGGAADGLGRDWEIVDGGITVKLYPSCAATHPTIDTLLDLRAEHRFTGDDVEAVEIGVDAVTPHRAHPRPAPDRPRGQVQQALLRRFRRRPRARRPRERSSRRGWPTPTRGSCCRG